MKFLSPVVWSEGMYLAPHHFQAHGRYFEDSVRFAITALWRDPYGLLGCQLDEEALRNGTLSLVHARGILPDGLPFLMPECDALPAVRPIADNFPSTRGHLDVLLAAPLHKHQGANCDLNGEARQARFRAETRTLRDDTTAGEERPIQLGRKNLRLVLETEATDGMTTLPLARVMRDGSGHLTFDPDFIPPCLQIAASDRLMLLLRRLTEILERKSATLGASGSAILGPSEIANFWLLHAVTSALAPLRHLWNSKRGHPEELFVELTRLAGALCTFALDSHPRTLPLYDHEKPGECFRALDRHIRERLETVLPTNCLAIPLEEKGQYFYEAALTDTRCLGRSQWLLGIRSNLGTADVITRTACLVKICSARFVSELVKRAISGLALSHVAVPPAGIPTKVEMQYFGIGRTGAFWDHIVETRRIGIYVPPDLPEPEVELMVILDA